MKKVPETQIRAEMAARQLGSSGLQKGHWSLVEVVAAKLGGATTRQAIRCVAEKNEILPELVRKRIGRVCTHMAKERTEAYMALWGEGKRPSPCELIDQIAAMVKE